MVKKPRTAKQLANDQRLRDRAKKVKEEDFVPTEVKEKQAAEAAKVEAQPELAAPKAPENAEITDVLPNDNQPTSTAPATAPVDVNLITAVVAAVMEAQRQNPHVAQAPPEAKLEELEANTPQKTHKARLGAGGEVQGIVFKYDISKDYYPDPTQRLLDEPRLARFAPRENFIFRWEVDGVEYKKNNITYAEPRFTLSLFTRLYNDDGEATGGAALVARQMLHEDEFTTRIMAMKMKILDDFDDSDEGFRSLMNEIRYRRFQQWLFALFTPPKIQTFRKQPKTQVINGKAVEVYDTEEFTDHDTAVSQTSTLQSEAGIGSVAVPE